MEIGYAWSTAKELPFTLRAVELGVAADKATSRVNHFGDDASSEFKLASFALFHNLTVRQAVDDWDELSSVACRAFAPLAK